MSNEQPIAIVGVSALFPGSLDSRGFWRDILAGKDLIDEVPPSHWLLDDYHDPDSGAEDKTYARRGAFLDEVDFAPMDYGVPPNILAATDTGQLLAMIVARQLLEDAYDAPFEEVDSSRIGVVLGVASTTELCLHMAGRLQQPVWEEGMRRSGLSEQEVDQISEKITDMYVPWQENTFPGLLGNVVSGRIANRFDLGGTNCVVDAACASSLAALEMGVNQLNLGQADMMITGGVDALNDILMYMCFSQTGALSKSGDCRPFSSHADGTMMAEGLGMFALKRLEDAEADDDDIYAVVRGIGSSSDGRAKSIYAPRPEGQSLALERAYEDAGYDPETVEMVEAHGTATPAGDAAEMRGLKTIFGDGETVDDQWCALGSVKSQIGHAKAAAGAAGLFKTVMSLNHRVLPPTIKVDAPNPDLGLDESPFYVNTEPRPWIRPSDHPRRNAVSAFGFGGTNFHVTLEEYSGDGTEAARRRDLDSELILLSADEPSEIVESCRHWAGELDEEGMLSWLAQQTQQQFDVDHSAKLSVVATDEEDLQKKLEQAAGTIESSPDSDFETPTGIHYAVGADAGDIGLLFPGQGSQYLNLGARWAMHFDVAREVWDRSADIEFDERLRLDEVVYPHPVFDDEARDAQSDRLTATEWAQPALGATSLSALRLLEEMGITPVGAAGHSYGEVTALCAAGVLDEDSMLEVSRKRGELMADASDTPGSMTAVRAGKDKLEEYLDDWGIDVVVANHNTPNQCVLSGATDAIDDVEQKLDGRDIAYTRLPVSTAFHSSLVSDSAEPFTEFLSDVEFGDAEFPVYANTTAETYPDDADAMRSLLGEQLANPVRFVDQVRRMHDDGIRTFVEVGPRSTLTKMVGKSLDDRPHHRVNTDRQGKSEIASLFEAIGALAVRGVDLDFEPLWSDYEEIDDPRQGDDAGFTVSISGTNYGKPYPADDPRPEPDERPALPEELVAKIGAQQSPTPSQNQQPDPSPSSTTPKGSTTMSSNDSTNSTPSRANSEPAATSNGSAPQSAPNGANGRSQQQTGSQPWQQTAGEGSPSWVDAFREQQRQTAEAHRTFQETTAEAHRAFLDTMDSSFQALGQIVSGQPVDTGSRSNASAESRNSRSQTTSRSGANGTNGQVGNNGRQNNQTSSKAATNGRAPNGGLDVPAGLAQSSQGQTQSPSAASSRGGRNAYGSPGHDNNAYGTVPGSGSQATTNGAATGANGAAAPPSPAPTSTPEPASTSTPTKQSTPTPEPAPAETQTPTGGDDVDVLDLLMATVADKTGYPPEMLEPEMELEADLGVDSIKQVEIMSEMEEEIPELPEVEASELADLTSLTAIADYLQGLLGGSSSGGAASAASTDSADASTAEPTADVDVPDLASVLMEVVAEKTGYPGEMLEPEMELEADLGVDSIKQVEIMSEMEERFPELPEVEANELAELDSLDEIAGYLEGLIGGREPRSNSSSSDKDQDKGSDDDSEDDQGTDGIARYNVRPVDAPACGWAMPGIRKLETIYAVSQDDAVASAVASELNGRGLNAVAVDEAPDDAEGVIYLDGLRDVDSLDDAAAINRKIILGARDLVADDGNPPRFFVTVQNTGGEFRSADGSVERAWLAGVGALAKTAAAEWPESSVKSIDLDADGLSAEQQAASIVDELLYGGPQLEVGLSSDGRRITPAAFDEVVDTDRTSEALTEGDVLVVSGGAKGVTATSIIELAQHLPLRFVLLGRTELVDEPEVCRGVEGDAELKRVLLEEAKEQGEMPSPRELQSKVKHIISCRKIRQTLRALEEAGSEARYASCDVRDADALGTICDNTRDDWGRIDGVVHGAGVLADSLIADKTADDFDFVFNTKIEGLQALLEATEDDELKILCLFSSVAARSGNPGQSDYAMANEVLNKVAQAESVRRGNSCRVKSLGWGPWDGGMVTPELKAHFEAEGVVLLPEARGAEMFAEELLYAPTDDVELVLGGSVFAEGVNGSQLSRGVDAEFIVDAEHHPYLDSHRLRDIPVVPAMLVVEWFTRFAEACCPHLVVGSLQNLEVRKGIQLEGYDDGGDGFTLHARSTDDSGRYPTLELELKGADGVFHYSAIAEMAPERHTAERELVDGYDFDVPDSPFSLDEAYGDGRLFHGPDFEVLTDIEGIGEGGGIAALDGLLRMDWPDEDWKTDTAAMDGALQIGLLWGLDLIGHQTLPMRVDEFTPFVGSPSDRPLVCKVRRADHSSRKIVADVLIETEDGQALCELRGVTMFAVPDGV